MTNENENWVLNDYNQRIASVSYCSDEDNPTDSLNSTP